MVAIEQHDVTKHLGHLALGLPGQLIGCGLALGLVFDERSLPDADLDELVIIERLIHGMHQRRRDTVLAHLHHGSEAVSERAEVPALLSSE